MRLRLFSLTRNYWSRMYFETTNLFSFDICTTQSVPTVDRLLGLCRALFVYMLMYELFVIFVTTACCASVSKHFIQSNIMKLSACFTIIKIFILAQLSQGESHHKDLFQVLIKINMSLSIIILNPSFEIRDSAYARISAAPAGASNWKTSRNAPSLQNPSRKERPIAQSISPVTLTRWLLTEDQLQLRGDSHWLFSRSLTTSRGFLRCLWLRILGPGTRSVCMWTRRRNRGILRFNDSNCSNTKREREIRTVYVWEKLFFSEKWFTLKVAQWFNVCIIFRVLLDLSYAVVYTLV